MKDRRTKDEMKKIKRRKKQLPSNRCVRLRLGLIKSETHGVGGGGEGGDSPPPKKSKISIQGKIMPGVQS